MIKSWEFERSHMVPLHLIYTIKLGTSSYSVTILKSLAKNISKKYFWSLMDVYQYVSYQFWILFCLSKMTEKKFLANMMILMKNKVYVKKIWSPSLYTAFAVIKMNWYYYRWYPHKSLFIANLKVKKLLKSDNFCRSSAPLKKAVVIGTPCSLS